MYTCTPRGALLYSKSGVNRGKLIFFLLLLQNIDCVRPIFVLNKNIKNIEHFPPKFLIFTAEKNLCMYTCFRNASLCLSMIGKMTSSSGKPNFYIEKLGFAGVWLFFLFLLQNIDCGYSLEPPRRGGSNVYPQSMF